MVKFYCEICKEHQSVEIELVLRDKLNDGAWGDIVCAECHFVIATMSADEEGKYEIVKVSSI